MWAVLSKLLFIHSLLVFQRCEFLLLKIYCRLGGPMLKKIPRDIYVSNNNTPWLQAAMMLSDLDMGTCGICDLKPVGVRAWAAVVFTLLDFCWVLRGIHTRQTLTYVRNFLNDICFHQKKEIPQCIKELRIFNKIRKKLNERSYHEVGLFMMDIYRIFENHRACTKVSGSPAPISFLFCFVFVFIESLSPHFLLLGNFIVDLILSQACISNSSGSEWLFKFRMESNSESQSVPATRTPGCWEVIPLLKD